MLRHSSLLSDFCSWGSWAKGPAVLLSLDRWTNDYVYGEWVLRSDCIPIRIQHQLPSISNSLFAQFAALDHVGPQVRSRVKRRSAFTAFPFWPFCALLKHLGAFIYIYVTIIPLLCFRPHLQPNHNGFNRSTSSALNARAPGDATGFHTPMPAAEDLGRLSLRQQLRYREMFDMIQ